MTLLAASEKKRRQKSPVKEAMMRGKFGEPLVGNTRNGRDSAYLYNRTHSDFSSNDEMEL